jgi:hypothetical protein
MRPRPIGIETCLILPLLTHFRAITLTQRNTFVGRICGLLVRPITVATARSADPDRNAACPSGFRLPAAKQRSGRHRSTIFADLKHFAVFFCRRASRHSALRRSSCRAARSSRACVREGGSRPAVIGAAPGDRAWDRVRNASPRGGQTFHRDRKSPNILLDDCARSATSGRRAEHAGDGQADTRMRRARGLMLSWVARQGFAPIPSSRFRHSNVLSIIIMIINLFAIWVRTAFLPSPIIDLSV